MGFSSDNPGVSNQLQLTIDLPDLEDDTKLFKEQLDESFKEVSDSVNSKVGGLFNLKENLTFKQFFTTDDPQTFRNGYRTTFDLIDLNAGQIVGGESVQFAHGLENLGDTLIIYFSCVTTSLQYFTAVYPDFFMDNVYLNFTNPNASDLSSAIAVCEYIKR